LNDLSLWNSSSENEAGRKTGGVYLVLGPATGGGDVLTGSYARMDGDGSDGFGSQQVLADLDGDSHTDWLVGSDPSEAFPDRRQLGILPGPIGPGVHSLDDAVSTWLPGDSFPQIGTTDVTVAQGGGLMMIHGCDGLPNCPAHGFQLLTTH
jgi:hypothetical protein